MIELTAYWGNDDAHSSIVLESADWEKIQRGKALSMTATSAYEGIEETVTWSFNDAYFSINGDDGRQCVCGEPIESLIVREA